jgi:hypothetical protein
MPVFIVLCTLRQLSFACVLDHLAAVGLHTVIGTWSQPPQSVAEGLVEPAVSCR